MTTSLPVPIPLAMPPGDAEALHDLVRAIAGAAVCVAEIDAHLLGAATSAPGWLGDDAAAAAAQIGAITALVREVSGAVPRVLGRLDTHREHLLETRRQVAALRAEQDEQFTEAGVRWSRVPDLHLQIMIDGPAVRAIVDELEAAEESRRRRHAALLEELEDDAAATARVLADGCAVVGGRGAPGDGNRVVAYLAAQLPGWGDPELVRLGRQLANRLTTGTLEEKADAADAAAPFAGRAAFADALLSCLGVEGVTYVLTDLGNNAFEGNSSVARALAAAFGAAVPSGGPNDPVGDVLDAEYVRAEDRAGPSDTVAAGLAAVLAAGRSMPSGGVRTRTVAEWSRQFLLFEREQRSPVGRRSIDGAPELGDPTDLAIGILADRADPVASAALLAEPRVWQALLRRTWGDGGIALGDLITQAGREPGAAGDRAVRTGLTVVGSGLAADDPAVWTVNRDTLAAVAAALGGAVAAHVAVAVDALQVGVDGRLGGGRKDVLQGLGSVTLDRGAAAAIEHALRGWAHVQPVALDGTTARTPLPVVAIPSAYVAVRRSAQLAAYAQDCLEAREEAERRDWWWEHTIGLVTEFIPGWGGIVAGVAEGYAAILLGMDGTWDNGTDQGLVVDRDDAAAAPHAEPGPQQAADVRADRDQAIAAFDRTASALGERRAPVSPATDWREPLEDVGIDLRGERMDDGHGRRAVRPRSPR